jgi:hypothetical protein
MPIVNPLVPTEAFAILHHPELDLVGMGKLQPRERWERA